MDALKGLARRATQTIREKVANADQTQDDKLLDGARKVRQFEKTATDMSERVMRAARLIDELSAVLRELADAYKATPDLLPEAAQLAEDVAAAGANLSARVAEHQKPLKEQAFDPLAAFLRELPKLRDAEEDRKKKQLEYDFFKSKVLELRRAPPKDFSRIPRNEAILEQWRTELWRSTEQNKVLVSALHAQGRRAVDGAVLTTVQVLGSFLGIASGGFRQQFINARPPVYPAHPLLQPAPLPPNPLPPFVHPGVQQNPGVATAAAAAPYDPSQQQQQQQYYGQPQPAGTWAPPPQQPAPHQQPPPQQQPWQPAAAAPTSQPQQAPPPAWQAQQAPPPAWQPQQAPPPVHHEPQPQQQAPPPAWQPTAPPPAAAAAAAPEQPPQPQPTWQATAPPAPAPDAPPAAAAAATQ